MCDIACDIALMHTIKILHIKSDLSPASGSINIASFISLFQWATSAQTFVWMDMDAILGIPY